MANNKSKLPEVDESTLLASIREQDTSNTQKNDIPVPKQQTQHIVDQKEVIETKEPLRRKRNSSVDYTSSFLQKNEFKTRQCVYISQQIHNTISAIVRVIADKDISVGGYIDTVLCQHLEAHKDEINELYKRDRKDLIP
ncbi:MAG: DUF3408 domain-containing protein [Bacteroidota bacterium]|nr:DUF3408 domain-containing protein [Bacteroidota bacterium]MDP4268528.1 DUF3408 domain-containing protein [Bacteroidota bacterium]